jgi:zinc protease
MLTNMSAYGLKADYVKDQENTVNTMTKERIKELANKYVNPNKMIWLVVGDAETQLERMKELGYGEPILLNERQKKIKK